MGIWDYISSTSDSLKRNTPGLTSVKGLCRSSYDHSWAAAGKICDAVRASTLSKHLSDQETRSKMAQIATNVAKNAAVYAWHEGLKTIPGGLPVYNTFSKSLQVDKYAKGHEEMKALQAKVNGLEEELSDCRSLLEQVEMKKLDVDLKSQNAVHLNKKPEDILRIFMMKEFIGRDFQDDLIVPGVRPRRKSR